MTYPLHKCNAINCWRETDQQPFCALHAAMLEESRLSELKRLQETQPTRDSFKVCIAQCIAIILGKERKP